MVVFYVWNWHLTWVCLPLCCSPKPVKGYALNTPSFTLLQLELLVVESLAFHLPYQGFSCCTDHRITVVISEGPQKGKEGGSSLFNMKHNSFRKVEEQRQHMDRAEHRAKKPLGIQGGEQR